MSFVVVENLNSARKKTEVTSKPCSLVSLSSAWLMLPNSPSPPVDQLLLLSLPLKLLPASHISPPMPTPGADRLQPSCSGTCYRILQMDIFGNGKWDQLRHMIKNMHGAFVFTKCLASQSPAFWHCALGWRISLSGPEIPATHKGKILDLFRTNFGFFPDF